ncbi:hypothetical protein VB773_15535 [Haloarculaceae archaeon H-GB2-1]|nr:hypothetical protein [Haloarculaceae archaeon H-GB1-1]MEA5387367.1 hypothetical protein [Haloarculaceae archaeon H-GB11]MEA5408838.1 hypothetical protein [Haloarculaceae archaeon H-GB2-1]
MKLNRLQRYFATFRYPISRAEVVDETAGVELMLADGSVDLGEVLERSNADVFDSADELLNEVLSLLPREAVGEPYQSEGEG